MADLIDRDALMKEICGNECGSVCDEECEKVFCNFYDYIMDAPAVNRWISCSERVPEDIKPVYITWYNPFIDYIGTGFAHYFAGNWYWYSQCSEDVLSEYGEYDDTVDVDVLAWMPMPEAYKAPEGGEHDVG